MRKERWKLRGACWLASVTLVQRAAPPVDVPALTSEPEEVTGLKGRAGAREHQYHRLVYCCGGGCRSCGRGRYGVLSMICRGGQLSFAAPLHELIPQPLARRRRRRRRRRGGGCPPPRPTRCGHRKDVVKTRRSLRRTARRKGARRGLPPWEAGEGRGHPWWLLENAAAPRQPPWIHGPSCYRRASIDRWPIWGSSS